MKTPITKRASFAFTFLLSASAFAQNGTWTNEIDSVWSSTTNWLNGVIASGAGNTATFSNELSSAVVVSLDSARTIGNLQFVQGAYTITNDGADTVNILTLEGSSKPLINVPTGMTPTIRRTVLAGTNGFILDGDGQLNLFKENTDSNNTLTGSVVLSNGTIQVQGINVGNDNFANTLALNSINSFTFINGTVNLQPAVNTSPEYGNVNGNLHVPEGGVGTIVLPVRFAGASGDNAGALGAGLGGTLTGSGTFNVRSRYVRGNVVGDWSAFAGLLDIGPASANADNSFRFGIPAGYPNARVNFSGTTPLSIFYYRSLTTNTTIPIGVLSGDNPQTFLNGSATAAFTLLYDLGALHTSPTNSATFAGTIGNAAGPAGLIKRGAGTLILTGNNNYSGPTTVSNGVLQIGDGSSDSGTIGSGPITNHGTLIFAHGAGPLVVTAPITGAGPITNIGTGGRLSLLGTNTYTAPTVSTAGKLIIGTASRATGSYILRDVAEGFGVNMTRPGATLSISNLTYSAAGTFDVDLGTFSNPTAAIVTNTGNIALNGDVTVNVTGTGLAIGTITVLQYNTRSGTGNFVLGTLPSNVTGFTFNDDTVNKRVTLTITVTFDNTLQWVGNTAGIWDIDNATNQVWRVVQSGQLTNYYEGAKVRFDDTATGTTTIDVSTTVSPTSVIVSNSNLAYRFAGIGAISGTTGLTKQGTNKLTFVNANTYSSPTIIEAGVVEVGDGVTDGALGTGAITNNTTLLLNLAVGPLTMANAIHGPGNVVQTGAGVVNLSGASTYSGGLTVRPGTTLGNNSGNAAGIGGGLRIESGTVVLGADIANSVGSVAVITNATFRNTGANRVIDAQIRGTNVVVIFDKTPNIITINRDMSDISGVITNTGTGLLRFNSGGGNNSTGSANALWVLETVGGFLQPRNTSVNSLGAVTGVGTLSAQQTAGGANLTTWAVGGLNTSTLFEGVINDGLAFATPAPTRYTAITKVGTGTWTLNNVTMSYRSSTVVSNGTLALAGSSLPDVSTNILVAAPGVLSVAGRTDGTLTLGAGLTNQTLRGDGTITGNIVLGALGRLEPGFSAGTLTVSGSATLGGTNVMELTTTGGVASDRLVAATINYGNGTLILTNLGNITGSNVFQLFSGTLSGSFANVITQSLSGVTWDLSQLNVNGSVRVIGPNVNLTPTNIIASVSGNQLDLQWPADRTGWELQTNAVSIANSASWFVYPPSLTTNRVILTIDPTRTNVYYRLHYQFTP